MQINITNKKTSPKKTGTRILFLTEELLKTLKKNLQQSDHNPLKEAIQNKIFTAEKGSLIPLIGSSKGENTLLVGLGKEKDVDISDLRLAAGISLRSAKKQKAANIFLVPPKIKKLEEKDVITCIAESFFLANYEYTLKSQNKKEPALTVTFYETNAKYKSLINNSLIECKAVNFTRNLVNENASSLTPYELIKRANTLAKTNKLKVKVLKNKDLKKQNLNLLYAVGQGAVCPPGLIILEYKAKSKNAKTVALVGKGITFDSGGINLKPTGHIEDMRMDMAGAAAVLGAIKSISELKLNVNIISVLACAENAIGSKAIKPGEIIKSHNGKTVEILNTDAEGRLALADALSYTEKNYKADYIIDLATLTGAALIALGENYAPLLTQDEKLQNKLMQAAKETDDKLWPLPLTKPYFDDMKSDVADLRNIGKDRNSGTIRGAVFLNSFIEKTKWAHIDIAGTGWSSAIKGHIPKYATGYGVKLLTQFCKNL